MTGEPTFEQPEAQLVGTETRDNSVAFAIDNPARAETDDDLRGISEIARAMIWAGRNYLASQFSGDTDSVLAREFGKKGSPFLHPASRTGYGCNSITQELGQVFHVMAHFFNEVLHG